MAPKSEAVIQAELKRLLEQIEVLRQQARERGCEFVTLSEEQLIRKLRGETSNSPFFTAQAWDQFINPGSPSFFLANYYNPDPQFYLCFASIFFGIPLGPDIASEIDARDTRWPYVSTELVLLDPGATGIADFKYRVPYVSKGTYFGNPVLWGWSIGAAGTFFDRGTPFYVTLK